MNFNKMNRTQLQSELESNLETLNAIEFSKHTSKSTFYNNLEAGLITKEQYDKQVEDVENFYLPRIEKINNEIYEIKDILKSK